MPELAYPFKSARLVLPLLLFLLPAALGALPEGRRLPAEPEDSLAVRDSLGGAGLRAERLRRRGGFSPAALLEDRPGIEKLTPARLAHSYPLYLDDIFRLHPSFVSGDSLGNGYARKFSSLGAGFASTGVYLDGMPLEDPLTGQLDWRLVAPEILEGASFFPGSAFGGTQGWTNEVYLTSRRPDPALASSRMEIAGGAYNINKVGGGVRRKLFGSGALHVQINKIQQNTEDFASKVEHIQYFTRLEQSLGGKALLSLEGLFFSNDQRRGGLSGKLRQTNTHLQSAVSGGLGEKAGYNLAYQYASSRHPFQAVAAMTVLEARRHGLQGNLLYRPAEKVTLGIDLQSTQTRPRGTLADSLELQSLSSRKLLGLLRFEIPAGWLVSAAAGLRAGRDLETGGIASLGLNGNLAGRQVALSWKREALQPALFHGVVSSVGAGALPGSRTAATADDLRAELGLGLPGKRTLFVGLLTRKLKGLRLSSYDPNPLEPDLSPVVDYRAEGLFYRCEGSLFGALELSAAGLELFGPPRDVPYLAARRHTAALSLSGTFFGSDLGYSLQGEMLYEGELYFPVASSSGAALTRQPARVNFGGAGSLRIIDFTLYGRLDFLMSDYYNGIDPLRLPGPRAVFGVTWDFRN